MYYPLTQSCERRQLPCHSMRVPARPPTLLCSRRVSTGLVGMSMAAERPGMGRGPLLGAPDGRAAPPGVPLLLRRGL